MNFPPSGKFRSSDAARNDRLTAASQTTEKRMCGKRRAQNLGYFTTSITDVTDGVSPIERSPATLYTL